MREKEKKLIDIPLKQLSRLSSLIVALRTKPKALEQYSAYERLTVAALEIQTGDIEEGFEDMLKAFSDLLSEAVWPG